MSAGYTAEDSTKRHSNTTQLAGSLDEWKFSPTSLQQEERLWEPLGPIFLQSHGLTLWQARTTPSQRPLDGKRPASNGYSYYSPSRGQEPILDLARATFTNSAIRVARTKRGEDVIVKVLVVHNEGTEQLRILRKLARGPVTMLGANHCLPLMDEFILDHVVFGIFPKAGGTMLEAYDSWSQNSVGDIMNMLSQALEGLVFIHGLHIAHRDAFHDNWVLQWHPESLRDNKVAVSRPRVYLIDFETAIELDPALGPQTCVGFPYEETSAIGGYARPSCAEMKSGNSYDPFKVDVWQLMHHFPYTEFKSHIAPIDAFIEQLSRSDEQSERMSAKDALAQLRTIVDNMSPMSLHVKPTTQRAFEKFLS